MQAHSSGCSTVITQRIGRLILIGLNRPKNANSINLSTADRLTCVLRDEFERNGDILGGVLYGEGTDFCTGLDLDELMEIGTDNLMKGKDPMLTGPMGPTKVQFTKPLVAAITGRAIGGGLELALACDLRVAEQDSLLGLNPRKYCIPMMDLGSVRLPALIGLSRTLDLTLTGRCLTAMEAMQFGLVNRVVKVGTAVGIAVSMVDTMCRLPGQSALLADRRAVLRASDLQYELARNEWADAKVALESEAKYGLKLLLDDRQRSCKTTL